MNVSRREIFIFVGILIVLSALGYMGGRFFPIHRQPALQDITACVSQDTYGATQLNADCVTQTIRSLLTVYSTQQIMKYIGGATTTREVSLNCHAIGHVVGEQTFANVGSVQGALSKCTADCGYGCIHGVVGAAVVQQLGVGYDNVDIAHADVATIKTIGSGYCTQGLPLCHAMGHLLYMNEESDTKALNDCNAVGATAKRREYCYQGVFMEDAGEESPTGPATPLFLTNATTSALASEDYGYPCRSVASVYQHACFMNLFFFQIHLFQQQDIRTGSARVVIEQKTCETFSGSARSSCFEGIGYLLYLTDSDFFDPGFCSTIASPSDRDSCILGVQLSDTDLSRYTDAINYCEEISNNSDRSFCLSAVSQAIYAHNLTGKVAGICSVVSVPVECVSAFANYITASSSIPDYFLGM